MLKLIPLPLLLAACATVGQTSDSRPNASYGSKKSADALTQCVAEQLGFLVGGPIIERSPAENRIAFDTGGYAYLVVSVRAMPNGSTVVVHHRLSYPKRVRTSIESCL
jgi:hypothetical protein